MAYKYIAEYKFHNKRKTFHLKYNEDTQMMYKQFSKYELGA